MLCINTVVQIKAYPGELMQLRIVPHDEQNTTTALLVEILGNVTDDNSVSTFKEALFRPPIQLYCIRIH